MNKQRIGLALVLALSLLFSAMALAQSYSDVARNTGYRDGFEKGQNDARQGKSFNLERHDAYKDADHGYRSSFGNKEDYKQQYRDAFRRGYQDGYGGNRARGPRFGVGRGEDRPWQAGPGYSEVAQNTGYRDGFDKGQNDARQGKSFRLDRHDAYNDADHGYRDSFGNKEDYKQQYRQAFQRGYEEGYGGNRGRRPRFGVSREENRPGQFGFGYSEVAQNTGYRDGLEKGQNDARQGKSFNLERHDAYKDADHGYRDSFGNKENYKQQYREAFRRGYEEGYRGRYR